MEMESGEFLLRAIPSLILFCTAIIVAIAVRFMEKHYYDGPTYKDF